MANTPGAEVTPRELIDGIDRAVKRLQADGLDDAVLNENQQFFSQVDDALHSIADEAEPQEDGDAETDDDTDE